MKDEGEGTRRKSRERGEKIKKGVINPIENSQKMAIKKKNKKRTKKSLFSSIKTK